MIRDTGLVDVLPLRQFALGTFRPVVSYKYMAAF